jgi:hypothetical protein
VVKKSSSTLDEKEKAFAIEDTSAIGKIFIADMQGKKVLIERGPDSWTVNKKYEVRNDYMRTLLSTIKRVNVVYPVPEAAEKTVITNMASNNKKVEIYDKKGELMRSYLVGGATLDSKGTYMLMEGSKTPFVTAIPGFQGVLDTRYVTDQEVIRSTSIFRNRMSDISTVSVEYFDTPDSTFTITFFGPDSFELKNNKGVTLTGKSLNKDRVRNYLQLYEFINCEGYENDLPKKDTILQSAPFCNITLIDRSQHPNTVVCYYMPRNSTSEQFDRHGNELKYDADHFFATVHDGQDFVILQQFHFGRLFKSFNYFRNSSKPKSNV